MGLDPVTGIGTGCWPGMKRLADYLFDKFGGWNLGCFNPASRAGGGPSLHAEGRAQDFAFNAHDPAERAAGDALFRWAVEHAEEIGLQEMLWRGAIWYWPRRNSEDGWGDFQIPGVYGPVQQGDHMSHVHMGIDKNAGMNWTPGWITGDDLAPEPQEDHMVIITGQSVYGFPIACVYDGARIGPIFDGPANPDYGMPEDALAWNLEPGRGLRWVYLDPVRLNLAIV